MSFAGPPGCTGKAAIRLLRRAPLRRAHHRGRPRRYGLELVPVLARLWELSDRACSKLLAPLLPTLVAALERHGALTVVPELRRQLFTLSPATIDRLLGPVRHRFGRQPRVLRPVQTTKARCRSAPSANGGTSPQVRSKGISSCIAARAPQGSTSLTSSRWMWPPAGPSSKRFGEWGSNESGGASSGSASGCPSRSGSGTSTTAASSSTGCSSPGAGGKGSASRAVGTIGRTIRPG